MKRVIFCMVVALAVPAYASLFWADGFDYADGELTLNDGTGDDVSGGLWVPHSGQTFDDNLTVASGQVAVRASGSEDANRSTASAMVSGDTWYYGLRFSVNDTRADPSTESINNDYVAHFKDGANSYRGRVYLDDPNVAGPTQFTLGLSASSGGQAAKWGTDLDFGTTYQMIVSYNFDTGLSEMWIDPVDSGSTKIGDTNGAGTSISALALRQDFIGGTPNNVVWVDTAAIGSDFDSVLSAIPEPSTLALLGLGGLLALIHRRR